MAWSRTSGLAAERPHRPLRARQHLQPCPAAYPQAADAPGRDPQADRQDPAEGPDPDPDSHVLQERQSQSRTALAKGKQLWDKRETERRRTADKEAREAVARGRNRK